MTYNFDPERWLQDNRRALEARAAKGELDEPALAQALAELERRYDDMLARLDGTYRLPDRR